MIKETEQAGWRSADQYFDSCVGAARTRERRLARVAVRWDFADLDPGSARMLDWLAHTKTGPSRDYPAPREPLPVSRRRNHDPYALPPGAPVPPNAGCKMALALALRGVICMRDVLPALGDREGREAIRWAVGVVKLPRFKVSGRVCWARTRAEAVRHVGVRHE